MGPAAAVGQRVEGGGESAGADGGGRRVDVDGRNVDADGGSVDADGRPVDNRHDRVCLEIFVKRDDI